MANNSGEPELTCVADPAKFHAHQGWKWRLGLVDIPGSKAELLRRLVVAGERRSIGDTTARVLYPNTGSAIGLG